jgi:hypothetical protein
MRIRIRDDGMIRRRRYYYENVFGVDQYSMKTLRALHTKYTRDYLTLFKSLSSMYGASPQKREIDDAVTLVQKVRGAIESILQSNTIDRADAKILYELTGQIEEKKQGMLEQAAQVKALRERLDKIQRETGISTKDLNVTRQIVRRGVKQAAGTQREGVMDFLARTAPGTLELGRRLTRGVTTAVAGPFAPALGVGYDIARGAAGAVGGLRKKLMEREERKLASRLRSYRPEGLEDVSRVRGVGTPLAGISGILERGKTGRVAGVGSGTGAGAGVTSKTLANFWNRGAYKAKYTRELLGVLKDIRKGKKGKGDLKDSLLGAVDNFAILGASMLPLLGKAGKFAALAVAIGWTGHQLNELRKASGAYLKAKKSEKEASEAFTSSVRQWNDLIVKEGIVEVAERLGKTVDQVAKEQAERERKARRAELAARPFHQKALSKINVELLGARDPYMERPEGVREAEIIRAGGGTTGAARAIEEQTKKLAELTEAIKKAAERMDTGAGTGAAEVPAGIGIPNVHDSGDALLNEQANGGLGLED